MHVCVRAGWAMVGGGDWTWLGVGFGVWGLGLRCGHTMAPLASSAPGIRRSVLFLKFWSDLAIHFDRVATDLSALLTNSGRYRQDG